MEKIVEILHELIRVCAQSLPDNRVGELHDLADQALDAARGAEEVIAPSTPEQVQAVADYAAGVHAGAPAGPPVTPAAPAAGAGA